MVAAMEKRMMYILFQYITNHIHAFPQSATPKAELHSINAAYWSGDTGP